MFGFDDQMNLVRAWGDIALSCMTTAAQISTAMLGQSETVAPSAKPAPAAHRPSCPRSDISTGKPEATGRSWYRAPDSNPFDATWFGMTWPFPITMPALASAVPQPLQSFQDWAKLLQFPAWPTVFGMPANLLTLPSPTNWPMQTLPWMAGMSCAALAPGIPAPASTAPFAAYRSASGHAVAQITFPNEVVAAVALPSSAASLLDTVFTWPRGLH